MDIAILINSILDNQSIQEFLNKKFDDGNNYYLFSLENNIENFKEKNVKTIEALDFQKIEKLEVFTESKYLKVNIEYFQNYKFIFEKFFNDIKDQFYGYMIIGCAQIYKFKNKNSVNDTIHLINNYTREDFYKYTLDLKYLPFIDKNIPIKFKIDESIKEYDSILKKYNFFIFTSNKDLKCKFFVERGLEIPNFYFYIKDISELENYKEIFKDKVILYLNSNDIINIGLELPKDENFIYRIERYNTARLFDSAYEPKYDNDIDNFLVYTDNGVNFLNLHTNSIYTDLQKENIILMPQTYIFSLMLKEKN